MIVGLFDFSQIKDLFVIQQRGDLGSQNNKNILKKVKSSLRTNTTNQKDKILKIFYGCKSRQRHMYKTQITLDSISKLLNKIIL